jgi:hypothetical protein
LTITRAYERAYPVLPFPEDWDSPSLKAIVLRVALLTFYGDPRAEDIAHRLSLVRGVHRLVIVVSQTRRVR